MSQPRQTTPILDGLVPCVQPRHGYRFSVDALLLAHFTLANVEQRDRFVELGTGSGIVSALLLRAGFATATAVEIQEPLSACAKATFAANRLTGRVTLLPADLRQIAQHLDAGSVRLVVANPPYFEAGSGLISPDPIEATARHEVACSMEDVLSAARYLLPPGGRVALVYPASRLDRLISLLPKFKLTTERLRLVHPKPDREASNLLLLAGKSTARTLAVLPPLVTHRPDGTYGDWYAELKGLMLTD